MDDMFAIWVSSLNQRFINNVPIFLPTGSSVMEAGPVHKRIFMVRFFLDM